MPVTSGNPFDHAFEMLGQTPEVATDSINSDALEKLTRALTSRAAERGRMVLLRSPRAGFGKTHLLMRLHQRVAHTHEFIPLEPSKGRHLNAAEVLDAVLRRFSRLLPAGGGLTVLDLLARRILAVGLEPLVRSGEVPSQDRESALQALQVRPVETFDFHNEEAVTARWAMANFNLLGPRLTAELAERTHAGFRPVAWWVELLFRYSSAPLEQTTRNSSLFETVFGSGNVETDMHEKLVTLLNLTGLVTSPVLVLDEVEGFSSNPEAALQVATFLNALHQSCAKLALIISVNGDVWETAFLPRLPCGLKDRLSDIVIDLRPMTREQAAQLLEDRAGEHAQTILDKIDLDTGVIYARGLIREASKVWADLELDNEPAEAAPAAAPAEPRTVAAPISLATPPPAAAPPAPEVNWPQPQAPAAAAPDVPEQEPVAPASISPAAPVSAPPATSDLVSAAAAAAADEIPDGTEDEVFGAPDRSSSQAAPRQFGQPSGGETAEQSPFADVAAAAPRASGQYESEGGPASGQGVTPQQYPPQPAAPQPFAPAASQQPAEQTPPAAEDSPFTFAAEQPSPSPEVRKQDEPDPASPFTPVEGPAAAQPVNSPFAIDPEAAPPSPFQPVEAAQPAAPAQAVAAPQQAVPAGGAPVQPHTVTSEDQEKVEDLLRQFRDRYGRDE